MRLLLSGVQHLGTLMSVGHIAAVGASLDLRSDTKAITTIILTTSAIMSDLLPGVTNLTVLVSGRKMKKNPAYVAASQTENIEADHTAARGKKNPVV